MSHRISREVATPRDLEGWVRFVFDFRLTVVPRRLELLAPIRPLQIPSEILRLLRIVAVERPQRVLEVGSAGGGTLFLFARAASPDAVIVGLDLPPSALGTGLEDWRVKLYEEAFAAPGQTIHVIRGDSQSPVTADRVERVLQGKSLDFLFLDADHSYEGVSRDFALYSPLVRRGGLIAFHDIVLDSLHRHGIRTIAETGEVPRFWTELKERYHDRHEIREIVENPFQDGKGIGVLRT